MYCQTTIPKNFKNLSFVSNDSTNYDSEITLNSNRMNTQTNNIPTLENPNSSAILNQSLNGSGNISSRRNSIKNQEFASFLNEWKSMHYYQGPFGEINNDSSLKIVPEEIDSKTVMYSQEEENIVTLLFIMKFLFIFLEKLLSLLKQTSKFQQNDSESRRHGKKSVDFI